MGQSSMGGFGGMMDTAQDTNEYQTCIGLNSDGDEMRVTFTRETSNNPWGGNWGNQWGSTASVRLSAVIASSQQSTLQGRFHLVVTEDSRTEEGCSSRALGDILADRSWWNQATTPRGVVQTPLHIMQGQTATYSEPLTTLTFQEMTGRGLALCPSQQVSSTCVGVIPLCCKIGYDSQPATTPFTSQNQFLARGVLAAPTNGGMNDGMQGFGAPASAGPMNGGMQGFGAPAPAGQMNGGMQGFGAPASAGPMNGGMQGFGAQASAGPMNGGMQGFGAPASAGPMNGGMQGFGAPASAGPMNGGMQGFGAQASAGGMNGGMQGVGPAANPGGMNNGMQGLNSPMNGGMPQGLPSGMNNGLGQGNNAQGNMGGAQGMGGLSF
ncbi:fibroin heavy chain-like [Haliotis rubra]|uniref:fibroin heavy chain-like n=1 Tax=Haliotis rubra TaxID=36100 RepID=UPI001EE527AA|nr:fibroin heavy chain-like [Haliotis rubra]